MAWQGSGQDVRRAKSLFAEYKKRLDKSVFEYKNLCSIKNPRTIRPGIFLMILILTYHIIQVYNDI